MFQKILNAFSSAWHFIVDHHEEEAHIIAMAETIVAPFIKSNKAKAGLQLGEEIAKRATDALATVHDTSITPPASPGQ